MSDFGRVPIMNIEEEKVDKDDKEIFDKPEAKKAKEANVDDDKKLKLKEHLAKCRAKSAEVRKAKAAEKKANKKPVGRPKQVKFKENVVLANEVAEEPQVEQPADKQSSKSNDEEEIFTQAKLKTIKEDKVLSPISEPTPTNAMFDMDMMLNKFDERMDQKLKAFERPTQPPTPQSNTSDKHSSKFLQNEAVSSLKTMGIDPNVYSFVSYMKDQEEKIRNEERTKYVNELEQKKNDLLVQNNRKYFKKLPQRQFHQPIQQQAPQENNMWDDLLNPKKRY